MSQIAKLSHAYLYYINDAFLHYSKQFANCRVWKMDIDTLKVKHICDAGSTELPDYFVYRSNEKDHKMIEFT